MHLNRVAISALLLPLLGAVLMLASLTARGQGYAYRHYTRENGLPSNTVFSLAQDSLGFIWVATDKGISRYDGSRFTQFTTDDGLPDNEIVKLFVDSKGRLWYCNVGGFFGYYEKGKFHNSLDGSIKGVTSMRTNFSQVQEDHLGQIWFSTMEDGLFRFDGNAMRHVFGSGRGMVIGETEPGKVLALSILNKPNGNMTPSDTGMHVLVDILTCEIDTLGKWKLGIRPGFENWHVKGNIVAGFTNEGLAIWDYRKDKILEKELPSILNNNKYLIKQAKILRDGSLLFCFADLGACQVRLHLPPDPSGIVKVELLDKLLPGRDVNCSLQDMAGGIWISTLNDGIYYLPHKWVSVLELPPDVVNKTTRRIIKDEGTQQITLLKGDHIFLAGDSVAPLSQFMDQSRMEVRDMIHYPGYGRLIAYDLWVVWVNERMPAHGGLDLSAFHNKRIRDHMPYYSPAVTLPQGNAAAIATHPIKQMLRGKGKDVWLACGKSIVMLNVNPEAARLEDAITVQKWFPSPRTYGLAWGQGDTLWVAAQPGLMYHTQASPDSLTPYRSLGIKVTSRSSAIIMLPDSSLLISTHGQGLIHKKGGKVSHITTAMGLPSNICNGLYQDPGHLVWVATQQGIATLQWSAEGLRLVDHPALAQVGNISVDHLTHDGSRLLASTMGQIMVFPLNPEKRVRTDFPMHITECTVNGEPAYTQEALLLAPTQNNLSFSFVALDYLSQGRITYEYRLDGADGGWIQTQSNSIEYSQLPPGDYTFQVRAIAFDGHRSKGQAAVRFTINRPWHATFWFRTLAGAALVAMVAVVFWQRLRAVRRRTTLELRLLESEQKALRSQMNPHFIFNSLNSIQRFLTTNNANESIRYLTKFGRLMRSILDNSRAAAIPIAEELNALRLYVELESLRTGDKFDFEIKVDPKLNEMGDRMPPLLLQPYVENAIWHGVMALEGRGHITVSLQDRHSSIHCSIQDNGVGRAKAMELKGKAPTGRKSHGMNITAERLALLNRDKPRAITVHITDLHHPDGRAAGTLVEMDIPKEF